MTQSTGYPAYNDIAEIKNFLGNAAGVHDGGCKNKKRNRVKELLMALVKD